MRRLAVLAAFALLGVVIALYFARRQDDPVIPDDAKAAGKTPADFPQTSSHVFDQMDGGLPLAEDERKGRNTWLLWTAGDQVFWNRIAQQGLGTADLLKTID